MSGKIDPDEVGRMVTLVYGQLADKQPFWCFVSVKPSRYDEFMRIVSEKKFDLRNYEQDGYGEIVVSGEGLLPPRDVTKKVAAMFGVSLKHLMGNVDPKAYIGAEVKRLEDEAE